MLILFAAPALWPEYETLLPAALAGAGIAAQVSRILAFGVTARVELDGVNGARGQHFEVEITRERIDRLGLAEGQAVRLLPSHLSLFESRQAATTAGASR